MPSDPSGVKETDAKWNTSMAEISGIDISDSLPQCGASRSLVGHPNFPYLCQVRQHRLLLQVHEYVMFH